METHNSEFQQSECKISLTSWLLGNQSLICDMSGKSGNQRTIITNAVGCWVLGAKYLYEACTGYSNILEMWPANEITRTRMYSGVISNLCPYIRTSQSYLLLIIQFSYIRHTQNPLSHSDTLQSTQHFSGRRHTSDIIHLKISQAGSNRQGFRYKLCYRTIQIGTGVTGVQKMWPQTNCSLK